MAREYFERALDSAREVGKPDAELRSLRGLGSTACERGDLDEARDSFETALTVSDSEEKGNPLEVTRVTLEQARLALASDDCESALAYAGSATETFVELDATHWVAEVTSYSGGLPAGRSQKLTPTTTELRWISSRQSVHRRTLATLCHWSRVAANGTTRWHGSGVSRHRISCPMHRNRLSNDTKRGSNGRSGPATRVETNSRLPMGPPWTGSSAPKKTTFYLLEDG